jgi:hypothetical protein
VNGTSHVSGSTRAALELGAPGGARSRGFWSEERSLSMLLALLVILHLAVPLTAEMALGAWVGALCLSLLAVSVTLTSFRQWFFRLAARAAAVVALTVPWLELIIPWRATILATTIADAALFAFLAASVATQVFRSGSVSAHRIRGAVVVYMLIGALFGLVYQLLAFVDPNAFHMETVVSAENWHTVRRELTYFSLVTLTTLGYGDITPASPLARALATLEGMSGQLYLAITIARLVSSQASTSDDPQDPSSAD